MPQMTYWKTGKFCQGHKRSKKRYLTADYTDTSEKLKLMLILNSKSVKLYYLKHIRIVKIGLLTILSFEKKNILLNDCL